VPTDTLGKPATVEDALREVSKIRSIVTDAVGDSIRSANQAISHGRHAAEDVIEEANTPAYDSSENRMPEPEG